MEPLSKPLMDWLLRLKLCTRADVRRCKGRVRQLARDLPAFDSVWIDALVHAGKITAYQAKVLESGHPERLAAGPWVLVEQLGHGTSATYLARQRDGQERSVIKRISLDEIHRGPAYLALRELVSRAKSLSHPSAIAPKSCLAHQDELIAISRYLPGPTLGQLLVRRGRFPARVVSALAKQLIDGLAALEECGIFHGDLTVSNLRISSAGRVVMVDAGVAPAIRPILNFHNRVSPDCYNGIAPELISTGNTPTTQSEFYALGCLLWQLLAGRPPFTTGDPLAKLMSHQTRRIPDVREIAPDTPQELAEILHLFTEPDPERRPRSFREFREQFGRPGMRHRRQVARFRAAFHTAIPHVPSLTPEAANRWPVVAGLMFLLSGTALSLMDAGAYSRLLAIPNQIEKFLNEDKAADQKDENASAKTHLKPLPPPNANGLIELADMGPYELGQIDAVGPLTIRGKSGVPAEIVISKKAGRLSTTDLVLEHLSIRGAEASNGSLLKAASRSLIARNCEFRLGKSESTTSASGISWSRIDSHQAVSAGVRFENCHAMGPGSLCRFTDWPRRIEIKNCLKSASGPLLEFAATGQNPPGVEFQLSQVTLRGASGLFRVEIASKSSPGDWLIQASDSVFDLHQGAGGLFQVEGPGGVAFLKTLQMQGRHCLLNRSANVAGLRLPESPAFQPLDASAIQIEGLVLAGLNFAGPNSLRPTESVLTSWEGPRFSSSTPGIDPTKWPDWMLRQASTPAEPVEP